jgi:hypothetical protein
MTNHITPEDLYELHHSVRMWRKAEDAQRGVVLANLRKLMDDHIDTAVEASGMDWDDLCKMSSTAPEEPGDLDVMAYAQYQTFTVNAYVHAFRILALMATIDVRDIGIKPPMSDSDKN